MIFSINITTMNNSESSENNDLSLNQIWSNDASEVMPSKISEIKTSVNSILEAINPEYLKSLSWIELLNTVQDLITLNIWNKEDVTKWFKWTSSIWTFVWWRLKEDYNPDLENFTFLLKWMWNIIRMWWRDPRYTFVNMNK
jgi:hypothetical protein